MDLTILGCHSATPRNDSHTTSQLFEIKNHLFLIDCGEGTQMQLRKARVKFFRIQHIFISHLHGDHFYGLIGLISTFRLLGRENDLHVYGPTGIKELITLQLKYANSWTNYKLFFHELSAQVSECIFEDENVRVTTLPLDHHVYTNGFLFEEKPGPRRINKSAIAGLELPVAALKGLKKGQDYVTEAGEVIPNHQLTLDPIKPKRYAFCSDTAYYEPLVPFIEGVDILYHEATFLAQHEALAAKTKHSTAQQAASIAQQAKVETLILGHFSTRYNNDQLFQKEAQPIFENTLIAEAGKTYHFR